MTKERQKGLDIFQDPLESIQRPIHPSRANVPHVHPHKKSKCDMQQQREKFFTAVAFLTIVILE